MSIHYLIHSIWFELYPSGFFNLTSIYIVATLACPAITHSISQRLAFSWSPISGSASYVSTLTLIEQFIETNEVAEDARQEGRNGS